jgi:hypothetical protein
MERCLFPIVRTQVLLRAGLMMVWRFPQQLEHTTCLENRQQGEVAAVVDKQR